MSFYISSCDAWIIVYLSLSLNISIYSISYIVVIVDAHHILKQRYSVTISINRFHVIECD